MTLLKTTFTVKPQQINGHIMNPNVAGGRGDGIWAPYRPVPFAQFIKT